MNTIVKENITTTSIQESSRQRQEPDWLIERRLQAWAMIQELPEVKPSEKPIHFGFYKRHFQPFPLEAINLPGKPARISMPAERDVWGSCAGERLDVDGYPLFQQFDPELENKGVILSCLQQALSHNPQQLKPYLSQIYWPLDDRWAALNTALWADGHFLYIPPDTDVLLPFYFLSGLKSSVSFPRILVVVDRGARVQLIQESASETQTDAALVSELLELHVGDDAQVSLIQFQHWGQHVKNHRFMRANLQRNATLHVLNVDAGSAYQVSRVQTYLNQPGANANLLGLTLGHGEACYRQNTLQYHAAPHTDSNLVYHTVLRDKSYAFFNGTIDITPAGQKTNSNQQNKNLLLSHEARADAIPNLEIQADDIACGHGAAVGSLDKEQLFYLMSRGFDQASAEETIVTGFQESVVTRLPSEALQDRVRHAIAILNQK